MATAGNITAVLTLNATGFKNGLDSSLGALEKFQSSISKFNADSRSMGTAIDNLFQHLNHLNTELKLFNQSITNLSKFSQLSTAINKMANGLKILSSDSVDVVQGVNTMNSIFKAFQGTLNGTTVKVEGLVNADRQLSSANTQLASSESQVTSATNQESASMEKDSVSKNKATNSTRQLTSANKSLGASFGMLRNAVTLVGSMIAYNFIHNLGQATNQTINAKSEMNGYFQMLGYTTREVEGFNKALDKTIAKFPRINKYQLGETISSIGVEFNLTTKEMEKAMPIVSMITSEYLRAGRNVNEASLAVKDVLQGQFQRLSRETGVKEADLEEAGWSGDNTDVMGLLKALDKVGKSRNWDTFVAKANSLNDAVIIMQNRFGEFSADLVEKFQPAIVDAFNQIMVIASDLGKALNGSIEWLSGNGIAQSIVKWGGLATAIGGVATALIVYRTGANLTEIAQMGLTRSIGATVLGLEAEKVAEHGLVGALLLSNESIDANTLKNVGRKNAIVSVITGIEAETVAEKGRLASLTASLFGVDKAIFREEGLRLALLKSSTQMDIATLKAKGLGTQMALLSASIGLPLAIIGAFTVALGIHIIKLNNTIESYKKFTDILSNGDTIISEAKDSVDTLTNSKKHLEERLSELNEGTLEYEVTASKLKTTTDDLATATQNYNDAVNSVSWSKHKQELYDESKQNAMLQSQREINQALIDYGVNVQEANELSSPFWQDAIDGWNQHYETLQKVNLQYSKNATTVKSWIEQLDAIGKTPKEISVEIRPIIKSGRNIAEAKEELGNATSLTEYIDKWAWLQVRQIEHSFTEGGLQWEKYASMDGNDWTDGLGAWIKNMLWGAVQGLGNLPVGQWVQGFIKDNFPNLVGSGSEWGDWFGELLLTNVADTDWGSIWNGILDFIFNNTLEPFTSTGDNNFAQQLFSFIGVDLQSNLENLSSDPLGTFGITLPDIDILGAIWDAILPAPASASDGSSDHPSFMDDVSSILGFDVQSWIDSFNADPIGTLGIELPQLDIMGLINSILPTSGDNSGGSGGFDIGQWLSDTFNLDGLVSSFMTNLSNIVVSATSTASSVSGIFSNLKSIVFGHISGLVSNVSTGFENAKNYAHSKMTAMYSSVSGVISQMTDAWTKMKDSILNSAKLIYDGVKSKFDSVKNTLKDFFDKLQDPSKWGSAGFKSMSRSPRPSTARRIVSSVRSGRGLHGAGVNPYTRPNQKVKLQDLLGMVDGNNMVTLSDFLSMFTEGGFGSWSFHEPYKKKIFDTGKGWQTGSPTIKGIGTIDSHYKVERFWNDKPSFTFEEFQRVAEAIFSQIPYRFYYDSEWKGSWLGALLSGALNCSDGAEALIALARVFGFDGYKVHTTTKDGIGHFFANINGVNMDTTNFQNSRSWSPLGGAGVPTRTSYSSRGADVRAGKTVNINIDMGNAVIYSVDDLDARMEEAVKRGMRAEFNDPYTIAL